MCTGFHLKKSEVNEKMVKLLTDDLLVGSGMVNIVIPSGDGLLNFLGDHHHAVLSLINDVLLIMCSVHS